MRLKMAKCSLAHKVVSRGFVVRMYEEQLMTLIPTQNQNLSQKNADI